MATRKVAMTLVDGTSTDTVKWHKRRHDELRRLRIPYLERWETIQRYIAPALNREFRTRTPKDKPPTFEDVIDTTATRAWSITRAGLQAGITSPARRWMRAVTAPPAPGELPNQRIQDWLQHHDDVLFRFWEDTDLYAMLSGIHGENLLFGTVAGYGMETPDPDHPFVWTQLLAGEFCIAENAYGFVDTIYRDVYMTVRQLAQMFSYDKLSLEAQQCWRNGDWDKRVHVVQHFGPTPWTNRYTGTGGEARWQEVLYEHDRAEDAHMPAKYLRRTEHEENPAFCGRWDKAGTTPWGISPGMEVLPDVKQLQEMEEKKAVALSLLISPPMQGPPSTQNTRVSMLPGDINYVEGLEGTGKGLMPAYQVQPKLAEFAADEELVRRRIQGGFYSDLFLAFTERPGVQPLNESEIWERKEEKLLGLGPMMDRLDREVIRRIIQISDHYLLRNGLMDDPPDELDEVDIEYLNVIAVAQRTQGLTAISDTVSFVATYAQQQAAAGREPTALDHLNERDTIQMFADRRGADVRVLLSVDEVEEIQGQRAQAQAQQAELEAAAQAAATAKDVAAAEELSARTQADQGPLATGGGPGALPADIGARAP